MVFMVWRGVAEAAARWFPCVASLRIRPPLGFRSPKYSGGWGAIGDGSLRTSEIGSLPAVRTDSVRPNYPGDRHHLTRLLLVSIKCFGSLGTLSHFGREVYLGIWRRTPGSSSYWRILLDFGRFPVGFGGHVNAGIQNLKEKNHSIFSQCQRVYLRSMGFRVWCVPPAPQGVRIVEWCPLYSGGIRLILDDFLWVLAAE